MIHSIYLFPSVSFTRNNLLKMLRFVFLLYVFSFSVTCVEKCETGKKKTCTRLKVCVVCTLSDESQGL